MNAIFLTSKEALKFINDNFNDATIRRATVDSDMQFDVNELPFDWSGTTDAYEVDSNLIGYYEPEGIVYSATFNDFTINADSAYEIRSIAKRVESLAEDLNIAGTIVLANNLEGEFDNITVDLYDEEEAEGNMTTFINSWNKIQLGERIKAERIAKAISIRSLSEMVGISKNNIIRIEEGKYNYTIDNLNKIATVLGLNISLD